MKPISKATCDSFDRLAAASDQLLKTVGKKQIKKSQKMMHNDHNAHHDAPVMDETRSYEASYNRGLMSVRGSKLLNLPFTGGISYRFFKECQKYFWRPLKVTSSH